VSGPAWGARRVVALAAILTALGIAFLVTRGRAHPTSVPPASLQPPTPDEVRTQELFRLNASLESDQALADAYQSINAGYFAGTLPPVRVRWEPRLDEIGPLMAEGFRLEGVTNGHLILLNPAVRDDDAQLRRVLCHEMIHVATRDQEQAHGAVFQSRLRELSAQGAFTGIVSTEDEKQELHRSLDSRARELTKEIADLTRARSELEADAATHQQEVDGLNARIAAASQRPADAPSGPERAAANARRERLQDRSWELNTRVRRYNESVAEFNGLVERYSLMVSYPDGLDRERVPRRAPLPLRGDGKR
jgi:hypothetical protein